jgi:ribose/xylose/arabinose/galactoside ABC-type transport system permease subunit
VASAASIRRSSRSPGATGTCTATVIDILNRAAPLMVVSLGMTLVIAVRGLDISVGAVVAIAAAVAALMIGGSFSARAKCRASIRCGWRSAPRSRSPRPAAVERLLVVKAGMQPIVATLILMVAGRGIAQLLTGGQIITVYYPPFFTLGNGYLLGLPVALWIALACGPRCTACCRAPRSAVHPRRSAAIPRPRASPASAPRRSRCACTRSAASRPAWPG